MSDLSREVCLGHPVANLVQLIRWPSKHGDILNIFMNIVNCLLKTKMDDYGSV